MLHYLGLFLLIFGGLAKLYFRKSSFERRYEAGVEVHSNYWIMLAIRFLESCSKYIMITGACLIAAGYILPDDLF